MWTFYVHIQISDSRHRESVDKSRLVLGLETCPRRTMHDLVERQGSSKNVLVEKDLNLLHEERPLSVVRW